MLLHIRIKIVCCAKMSAFVMAFDKFMLTDTRANIKRELPFCCLSMFCLKWLWENRESGTPFAKYQVNIETETRRGSETNKEQIKDRRL